MSEKGSIPEPDSIDAYLDDLLDDEA